MLSVWFDINLNLNFYIFLLFDYIRMWKGIIKSKIGLIVRAWISSSLPSKGISSGL